MKNEKIKTENFFEKASKDYYEYGVEINENRSIGADLDGLKPVSRRGLWVLYDNNLHHKAKPRKAAKCVGDVIGRFHPHGDSSAYEAYVTAAHMAYPLVDGSGNWGTMTDPAAAMRYTEMRMSKYAELVFFDPFYQNTLDMVLNFDDTEREPLMLVSLLPNLLLNGNFGIGWAIRSSVPCFTMESLIAVIRKTIKSGKECTAKMCKDLVLTTDTGGVVSPHQDNVSNFKEMLKNGQGRIHFTSSYVVDKAKREIEIFKFAPLNLLTAIERAGNDSSVVLCTDITGKTDKLSRVLVRFKSSVAVDTMNATAQTFVNKYFASSQPYDIKVTSRFLDDDGEAVAKHRATTVPELINMWITYRFDLERKACGFHIDRIEREIHIINIKRKAIKFLDLIFKLLKNKKYNEADIKLQLSKHMKISIDDAETILEMKVRQLKALDDAILLDQIKVKQENVKELKIRKKHPEQYVPKHLDTLVKELIPKKVK